MAASSRSTSSPTTHGSWRASSIRSSSRGQSCRTRCSTGSSRPPSPCATAGHRRSGSANRRRPRHRYRPSRPHRRRGKSSGSGRRHRHRELTAARHRPPVTTPIRAVRPRARPLASRAAFGFGTGVALGVALGSLAWLADQLPYPWPALIPANAIGAWLGLGFLLGASAKTVPTGALRGLIGLLSAVAAYYALIS